MLGTKLLTKNNKASYPSFGMGHVIVSWIWLLVNYLYRQFESTLRVVNIGWLKYFFMSQLPKPICCVMP